MARLASLSCPVNSAAVSTWSLWWLSTAVNSGALERQQLTGVLNHDRCNDHKVIGVHQTPWDLLPTAGDEGRIAPR